MNNENKWRQKYAVSKQRNKNIEHIQIMIFIVKKLYCGNYTIEGPSLTNTIHLQIVILIIYPLFDLLVYINEKTMDTIDTVSKKIEAVIATMVDS